MDSILSILIYLLTILILVLIGQTVLLFYRREHSKEIEELAKTQEEELMEWTAWLFDPEVKLAERKRELREIRDRQQQKLQAQKMPQAEIMAEMAEMEYFHEQQLRQYRDNLYL